MTAPEPLPAEYEALAIKVLESRVKVGLAASKAVVQNGYAEGESRKFRTPGGLKLGTVLMTDPDATWQVVDSAAHEAHLRSFPGNLEDVAEIDDEAGAIAYLAEHAPQFLAFVSRVKPEARRAAMDAARAGDDVPGVAFVKPAGQLRVTPDRSQGADAVAELVDAKLLTWDGRRVLERKQEEAS